MFLLSHRIGRALLAASFGKVFEKRIKEEVLLSGVNIVKIPEEFRNIYSRAKTIQIKTCFDFMGGIDGVSIGFDAKACERKTFNIQSLIMREKKRHQYDALVASSSLGTISGYLVWFYNQNKYSWINVKLITKFLEQGMTSFTHETPGVCSMDDNTFINLRFLMGKDLIQSMERISKECQSLK